MKNLIERCFLRYITSPLAVSLLSLGVATTATAFGVFGVYKLPPDRLGGLDLAGLAVLFVLGFLGLDLVLTILHIVGGRLLVNYNPMELGLYVRVKDGKVEAANPQLGRDGVWISLPRTDTDQPHSIEVELSPQATVVLEISFTDDFVPEEVYEEIVRWEYSSFYDWVEKRFDLVAKTSPAVLEQLEVPSMAKLTRALEEIGFFIPLSNVGKPVKFTVIATAEGEFKGAA